jgi:hypothetical protein
MNSSLYRPYLISTKVCSQQIHWLWMHQHLIYFARFILIINDAIKMNVKMAPFGTFNKLLISISYLVYILTGKSKSLFDCTISVIGKVGSPYVQRHLQEQ